MIRNTIYLPAAIGFVIGGFTALLSNNHGMAFAAFTAAAISIAVLIALLIARKLWLANAQHVQIVREEIDAPREHDEFATERRVEPADLLYDLTVGFHGWDEPTRYGPLTRGELSNKLAEHDVTLPDDAIRGRHVRSADSRLITWQPSTTDTGETR